MKTRTKTSQEKREVARIEVGRKLLQLSVRRDEKLAKRSSVDIRIILMIRSQYGRLKGQAVVKRGVIENYASHLVTNIMRLKGELAEAEAMLAYIQEHCRHGRPSVTGSCKKCLKPMATT
jgi:predicted rRNA methylase YqxC with S4 and FtsJ domains